MKNKNLFRAGLIFSLSALLSCGAIGGLSLKDKVVNEVDAANPYTVYLVSGNSNWTSWNNRFKLGDGVNWSNPTISPIDSDFGTGDSSNFNKAKIGSTTYNFQKISISTLNSTSWITVQKWNADGTQWEADGRGDSDSQQYADGASKITSETNNVIYVEEYSGRPWLNDPWKISGWYYKVKLLSNLDSSPLEATSLQKNGYTPTTPSKDGYDFKGWYTNSACTTEWDNILTSDTTLYAKFEASALPQLDAPILTKDDSNNVTWNAVTGAVSYSVTIDGVTTTYSTTDDRKVSAVTLPGTHTVSVKAIGDNTTSSDSNSSSISYVVDEGFYLVGSFQTTTGWDTTNWENAKRFDESSPAYTVTLNLSAEDEIKAVFLNTALNATWPSTGSLVVDELANIEFPVEKTSGGNIKFSKAGNYTIKIEYEDAEQSTLKYTVTANDYTAPTYKVKIGENTYPLTLNSGTEYKTTDIDLKSGSEISIIKDETEVSTFTSKEIYNNNIDVDKKVMANATSTIYVDISTKTIFSDINATAGFHMLKNGEIVNLTQNGEDSSEWYTAALTFTTGDTVRFIDVKSSGTDRTVVFDAATMNEYSEVKTFEFTAGTGWVATANSTTAVYLQLNSDGNAVYFGSVSEELARAKTFASDFYTAIRAICKEDGSTDKNTLSTEWQAQKTTFDALPSEVKAILKNATSSHSVSEIAQFISLYEIVLARYGEETLGSGYDFLEKNITSSRNITINSFGTNVGTGMIAIIVVTILGLTVIGSVVFIKSRKHS